MDGFSQHLCPKLVPRNVYLMLEISSINIDAFDAFLITFSMELYLENILKAFVRKYLKQKTMHLNNGYLRHNGIRNLFPYINLFYFIMSYVCLFLVSLAVIIVKHKNIFYHLIKQPDFS